MHSGFSLQAVFNATSALKNFLHSVSYAAVQLSLVSHPVQQLFRFQLCIIGRS